MANRGTKARIRKRNKKIKIIEQTLLDKGFDKDAVMPIGNNAGKRLDSYGSFQLDRMAMNIYHPINNQIVLHALYKKKLDITRQRDQIYRMTLLKQKKVGTQFKVHLAKARRAQVEAEIEFDFDL